MYDYLFLWHHFQWVLFPHPQREHSLIKHALGQRIYEWIKKWKRHFFFCRWCEKKQPPAETVYINSICLHLVYFVVCPLLSWLNGNLIILFLFSVIYITSCNGIFIKKMLTFFRWNPSKNTLHPGGWVSSHSHIHIHWFSWMEK